MPPERFGAYLREFDGVLARHGRRGVYYGHFGDGCMHVRLDFPLDQPDGTKVMREFLIEAAGILDLDWEEIVEFDPLTGKKVASLNDIRIYANSHYVTPGPTLKQATEAIRFELAERLKEVLL